MAGIVVGLVVVPDGGVVVNVHDEHAAARQLRVPTCLLTVFQHEILVAMAVVVDDVALAAIFQSLHTGHVLRVRQFDRLHPSCHPPLIGSVAAGHIAVAVVASAAHQVPDVHAPAAAVVYVVEVGIAQTVAELVTHGADAGNRTGKAVQLATAGVGVDGNAVELDRSRSIAVVLSRPQVVGMRPNGVGRTAVGLAFSGIYHVDLVDIFVTVPIIVGEVYLTIGLFHGFDNHLCRMLVFIVRVVAAIVSCIL